MSHSQTVRIKLVRMALLCMSMDTCNSQDNSNPQVIAKLCLWVSPQSLDTSHLAQAITIISNNEHTLTSLSNPNPIILQSTIYMTPFSWTSLLMLTHIDTTCYWYISMDHSSLFIHIQSTSCPSVNNHDESFPGLDL